MKKHSGIGSKRFKGHRGYEYSNWNSRGKRKNTGPRRIWAFFFLNFFFLIHTLQTYFIAKDLKNSQKKKRHCLQRSSTADFSKQQRKPGTVEGYLRYSERK